MVEQNETTTVRVKGSTKKLLDILKIIPEESYDSVLQRLIKQYSEAKK